MRTRHAVVTGGGTGIGSTIALKLADSGARITIVGRRPDPLEAVAAGIDAIQAQPCDVTDPRAVSRAFADATGSFGPIDILVNNAGAAPTAPFNKLAYEQWRQVMAANLDSVFHCCQAVLPDMQQQQWGRIINIASTAALKGYAYVSAYSSAKHAVLGLTRSLALELAQSGVTVNAICPGYTDTDIVRGAVADIVKKTGRSEAEALQVFTGSNPQGRLVHPSEVANSVIWLCQDDSAAVTGQAISISGGEVM